MIMKKDVSREIEELTGRKVIGFMSDNHIDPTWLSKCSCWNRSRAQTLTDPFRLEPTRGDPAREEHWNRIRR